MTSFQVDQFEVSEAIGDFVALRLDGVWISPEPVAVAAPVLLVRSGAALERFEPAQGTDTNPIATPAGDNWRATFDIPAALLQSPEAGFALEVAGGLAFALPDPGGSPAAAAPQMGEMPPAPVVTPAAIPTAGVPESSRADHEFEALQEAVRELQSRLEAERRARRAAEDLLEQELQGPQIAHAAPPVPASADAERLSQLQLMVADLESRVRAAGALSAAAPSDDQLRELEQRLGALEQSNAALERRAGDAEREAQSLKAALQTTREAHAHAVSAALAHEQAASELRSGSAQADADVTVRESRERVAELEARSGEIEMRAAELETALAEAQLAARQSAARLVELQAQDSDSSDDQPMPESDPEPVKRRSFRFARKPKQADVDVEASEQADHESGVPEGESDAEAADVEAGLDADDAARKRSLAVLLIVVFAVGALLAAEANGLVNAWPINP